MDLGLKGKKVSMNGVAHGLGSPRPGADHSPLALIQAANVSATSGSARFPKRAQLAAFYPKPSQTLSRQ
jgi:hypothetical protein